ncbi:hypothetical protein TNIN_32561 [Trichonephila inaurata madagascariensis]|uniref:Uncharacterized protein n=1 Tax=Trichonephila inaurata madagascariensis TaxID=2747483 RepID=A0A8X6XUB9_9ARAC|nr:hypothetical protein TNIN_32561 [Trichonephila inaurata madagascariensis]
MGNFLEITRSTQYALFIVSNANQPFDRYLSVCEKADSLKQEAVPLLLYLGTKKFLHGLVPVAVCASTLSDKVPGEGNSAEQIKGESTSTIRVL